MSDELSAIRKEFAERRARLFLDRASRKASLGFFGPARLLMPDPMIRRDWYNDVLRAISPPRSRKRAISRKTITWKVGSDLRLMDTIQHHPEIALVIATLEISMIHEYEWRAPPRSRPHSHTSIRYGERFVLKLFRRLHWGVNPELELGRFLTEQHFLHAPPLAGALEYHRADGERLSLAAVHGWLPNAVSGWDYTLRALDRYYERVLSLAGEGRKHSPTCRPLMQLVRREFPREGPELVGTYLESARLLAVRTAEMHLALAGETTDPDFAPEPFSRRTTNL